MKAAYLNDQEKIKVDCARTEKFLEDRHAMLDDAVIGCLISTSTLLYKRQLLSCL